MRLVLYQNFCRDLHIIVSCKPAIITTIPAATPNNASISSDLLSAAKYKFPQNELGLKL